MYYVYIAMCPFSCAFIISYKSTNSQHRAAYFENKLHQENKKREQIISILSVIVFL